MRLSLNNSSPKIGVIIPLYNQKEYIGEAIESILNQTYPYIKLVVINDGSTDNPFPILDKYNKDITLINQKNKGLAAARNRGLRECDCKYIQFLDADDFLHKDKIKLQLEFSESHDADISYCEIAQFEHESRRTYLRYIGEVNDMFSSLYNFWCLYPLPIHSLLIKNRIFKKYDLFDEELKANEDRYFLSKLAVADISFKYFPFIGGYRRDHKHNMNKDRLRMLENTIQYYRKLNKKMGDDYLSKKFGYTGNKMMCANLTFIYRNEIANGRTRKELKRIRKLFKEENIKFEVEPIPLRFKKLKFGRFFFSAYFKKLVNILFISNSL